MVSREQFPDDELEGIPEREPDVPTEEVGDLTRLEEELRLAGKLPESAIEEAREVELDVADELELNDEFIDALTEDMQRVLGAIGLTDPENITADRLRELDAKTINQLDEATAELLFFDTRHEVWKWLGSEKVTADHYIGRLSPPDYLADKVSQVDLEELRRTRRARAADMLPKIGLDEIEMNTMLLGDATQQQNVLRLAYVIEEQPQLKGLLKELFFAQRMGEESLGFNELVGKIKAELISKIGVANEELSSKAVQGSLDNIEAELYYRGLEELRIDFMILDLIDRQATVEDPEAHESSDI